MVRAVGPGIPFCPALLLLLPGWTWAGRIDAHALCYDFTLILNPRPGQGWCEVQGHVDWEVFLFYDCGSNEVKPISPLGKKVDGTRAWEDQVIMLRDAGEIFKERLPDIKLEDDGNRAPSTMAPDTAHCQAMAYRSRPWSFPVILTVSALLCIFLIF
ncbi:NKG2D ligand 2 [Tupaia chinensis]|uniref:NKG2D ligand 2 n=1 Tax=Tupaia chinensis TaxID=246437 RepID=L9LDJ2_TUPCH|nr:NKG2D ligand 2 [Tupaia chinensis]